MTSSSLSQRPDWLAGGWEIIEKAVNMSEKYNVHVQDFYLFRILFSSSRTPAKGKYHFKGPPCLLTLKYAKEDWFSGRRMAVTRSEVVSGPFEVQGRVRRSDVRVCLLAVTGHWLHLLSLEAFEKGRGGRYGDITRLFEMFCQKQKKAVKLLVCLKTYYLVVQVCTPLLDQEHSVTSSQFW